MQKIMEKVILGLVILALVLAIIGLLSKDSGFTNAGVIVLMVGAVAYAVIQVILYFQNDVAEINGSMRVIAIVSSVVAVIILCVGVLALSGKLNIAEWFTSIVPNIKG